MPRLRQRGVVQRRQLSPLRFARAYRPLPDERRDRRRLNIEARNDRDALIITGTACAIGVLYGITSSSGLLSAIFWEIAYGTAGLLVGVPIAIAVNLTRWLVR